MRVPVPEMTLPTVKELVRLNTRLPLSVIGPDPIAPAAPPLPICRVPELIVTVPLIALAPVRVRVLPLPAAKDTASPAAPVMTPL